MIRGANAYSIHPVSVSQSALSLDSSFFGKTLMPLILVLVRTPTNRHYLGNVIT